MKRMILLLLLGTVILSACSPQAKLATLPVSSVNVPGNWVETQDASRSFSFRHPPSCTAERGLGHVTLKCEEEVTLELSLLDSGVTLDEDAIMGQARSLAELLDADMKSLGNQFGWTGWQYEMGRWYGEHPAIYAAQWLRDSPDIVSMYVVAPATDPNQSVAIGDLLGSRNNAGLIDGLLASFRLLD